MSRQSFSARPTLRGYRHRKGEDKTHGALSQVANPLLLQLEVGRLKTELAVTQGQLAQERAQNAILTTKNDELQKQATTHPLTELPTLPVFQHDLETAIKRYLRDDDGVHLQHKPFVVVFIDLDELTRKNHVYGHPGADKILKTLAKKIATACRANDQLYHRSGDEFLMMSETNSPDKFIDKIRLIQDICDTTPFEVSPDKPLAKSNFSFGYAVFDSDFLDDNFSHASWRELKAEKVGKIMEQLELAADARMYANKQKREKEGKRQPKNGNTSAPAPASP